MVFNVIRCLLFYFLVCSICWILAAILLIKEKNNSNSNSDMSIDVKNTEVDVSKLKSKLMLADKIRNETDICYQKEVNRKYQMVMDDIKSKSEQGIYNLTYNVVDREELCRFVVKNKDLFINEGFHITEKVVDVNVIEFNVTNVTISWR